MKKENFDKQLKETLIEYVKDTESEPAEKIKFSKRHERNMEEIFKSIENGTLGNFEVEENVAENKTKNNMLSVFSNRVTFNRVARVTIFVLFALVVSLIVAPGIEAWKTEDLNLYEDERGEYAWVLPNDVSEMLDHKVESGEEYLEIFGWLPEGAEVKRNRKNSFSTYIELAVNESEYIILKIINDDNNFEVDIEGTSDTLLFFENTQIMYFLKENKHSFTWKKGKDNYYLYGNLKYDVMIKIIENINY